MARGLLLSLVTLLLILPVVICTVVQTTSIRIVIVVLSTLVYLLFTIYFDKIQDDGADYRNRNVRSV
jgi:ABC-type transport system involved in cytochrome c biogenesis permease component